MYGNDFNTILRKLVTHIHTYMHIYIEAYITYTYMHTYITSSHTTVVNIPSARSVFKQPMNASKKSTYRKHACIHIYIHTNKYVDKI